MWSACALRPGRDRARAAVAVQMLLWLCCAACDAYNPRGGDADFARCCSGLGTCVPQGLVDAANRARLGSDSCAQAMLCVPTALAENAAYVPTLCHASGAEGRCLPNCLPDLVARSSQLEQDICPQGYACTPCYDPRNGADSGSCHLGADPGPREPAKIFGHCCGSRGLCVPSGLVAKTTANVNLSMLGQRDCSDPTALCLEADWLADVPPKATSCHSIGGFEGRCIARCVADMKFGDTLPRDSCAQDELCAPCYDPRTGSDTGACSRGSDTPKEPRRQFRECCDVQGRPQGRCVPRDVVQSTVKAAGMEALPLGRDRCEATNDLCLPSTWLDNPNYVPPECRVAGTLEGRCLPACLQAVADRAGSLQRWNCDLGAMCVPCYDPIDGSDTGACRVGHDAPQRPAVTFDHCCGEGKSASGRCVPRDLVSSNGASVDLSALGQDTCPASSALCVPEAWLGDAPALQACKSLGTLEGRCMPACLPGVAKRSGQLQRDGCEHSELCVPCYDPLDATDTGACRIGSDKPAMPPQGFASCCGSGPDARGRCVPSSSLLQSTPATELARFARDTCATDALCVPTSFVNANAVTAPATCRSVGGAEGRCLSTCLPDIAKMASTFQRGECEAGSVCVPCYDPRDGTDTTACRSGSDRPREPAPTAQRCCGSADGNHGHCLSREFVPASATTDVAHLGADTCQSAAMVCVPDAWLSETPSPPPMCRSIGDLEGRCVPACLPDVAPLAERLNSRGCESWELCAPCYDPRTLKATGACTINGDRARETPRGFASCCGMGTQAKGTCLPTEILTQDQRGALQRDTCRTYDSYCIPSQLAETPPRVLARCSTAFGTRGVCMGACFLANAADLLSTGECRADERCVPCSLLAATGIGCE